MKNHLANESSLYLQQHATNPVDWYPWGQEALDKAKKENKPILLSIGYSACHWCHVMAAESFSDEKTAELMNQWFVNIKVDREERPDLDKLYQLSHELLTGHPGGWPLTVFLTPDDLVAFFSGTYFPPEPRYQLPSFKEVLTLIHTLYQEKKEDIHRQNKMVIDAFQKISSLPTSTLNQINDSPLKQAYKNLLNNFDEENGGFIGAPKFPRPTCLEVLLCLGLQSKEGNKSLMMFTKTLKKMAEGGIYDQVSGGFFRYSVDEKWRIPHFEKMLYDNALLLTLYAQAYSLTQDHFFYRIAEEVGNWVIREMQSQEGGYYASIAADSEGKEGAFYVWTKDEIKSLLTSEEYEIINTHLGLSESSNFENKWHLYINRPYNDKNIQNIIDRARKKLFEARENRIHPNRDMKTVIAWNALMIKGMSIAGSILQCEHFIESAKKATNFIKKDLSRLKYLDDYAFLIDALLALLQSQWDIDNFTLIETLTNSMLIQFEDKEKGGFYFTPHDYEKLFYRQKYTIDEAIPAGNGIAATLLGHLGYITGNTEYLKARDRTLLYVWQSLLKIPDAYCTFLITLDEYLYPPDIFILRGKKQDTERWESILQKCYSFNRITFTISDNATLPISLKEKKQLDKVTAYICQGSTCLEPIISLEGFQNVIQRKSLQTR